DPDPSTYQFNWVVAFTRLKEAFQVHYGIELGTTPPEQVVTLIQGRPEPIRPYLVVALDTWSAESRKENTGARTWVTTVLKQADTDPWRQRAREALAAGDEATLKKVVLEATAARHPPAFLHFLAWGLPFKDRALELDLSRRLQRAYPGDFWANAQLA